MERGVDARDNAYYFYKYIKTNHPQQKVYYIINKISPDYEKVKYDAVEPYSLKYYWLVYTCERFISTHSNDIVKGLYRFRNFTGIHKKYCMLQHGVTGNYVEYLSKNKFTPRLFICGARPEYDYVLNHFGHPNGVVKYTGLARFDTLHNQREKNQILVMPTWRKVYNGKFEDSQYCRVWNSFLNNKKLGDILSNCGIQLVFYPHIEVHKHIHHFRTEIPNVTIASFANYDVQELLNKSAVLITDYSSVHFDFAYMKKPLIYFQFDREDFFEHHYQKGYFDYDTMGFGKVCKESTSVVEEIQTAIQNDFKMDPYYLKRTEEFFPLHDNKNCERIYNEIIK